MNEKIYNYNNIIEYIKPQLVNYNLFNNTTLKNNIEIKCLYCNNLYSIRKKQLIHSYLKQFNSGNLTYKKYCSNKCYNLSIGNTLKTTKNCLNCNNIFIGDKTQKYCSHKCSALTSNKTRILNDDILEKLRKNSKIQWKKHLYNPNFKCRDENGFFNLICKICKKEFKYKETYKKTCSPECYTIDNKLNAKLGWIKYYNSIHRKTGRSYNEKYFYELIKQVFPDAINNRRIFNGFDADVIIPTMKLAIHWNGIWHYKPIISQHHFNEILSKDKLRYKEIENCGYKNYIIIDIKSCKNYEFVKEKFTEFLNNFSITQTQPLGGIV